MFPMKDALFHSLKTQFQMFFCYEEQDETLDFGE